MKIRSPSAKKKIGNSLSRTHPKIWKKILFSILLIGILISFSFVLALITVGNEPPKKSSKEITMTGTIISPIPYLVVQVSPPGYPIPGTAWKISVYEVSEYLNEAPILKPAPNSTVQITLMENGKKIIHQITTDSNGETNFEFMPDYTAIAFSAFTKNITRCETVALSTQYNDSQGLDRSLLTNLSLTVVTIAGFIISQREKAAPFTKRNIIFERVIFGSALFLFAFVTVVSSISRIAQNTIWGYPENILWGVITVTSLEYLSIIGIVLFMTILFYALIITFRKNTERKF